MHSIEALIRPVADFPVPGVTFRDITPLLADATAFARSIELLAEPWRAARVQAVCAVEARGFILGAGLATGGTLVAARTLVAETGAEVVGAGVLIELPELGGRARWGDGVPLHALLRYS